MGKKHSLSDIIAQHSSKPAHSIALPRTSSSGASAQTAQAAPVAPVFSNASRTEQTGRLVVTPPTPEQNRIFESEFGLTAESIDSARIELVHYTPSEGERVGTYLGYVSDDGYPCTGGTPKVFKCSLEEQWSQELWMGRKFIHLPPIPQGHSLRAPIWGAQNEVVGYVFYRLRHRGGDQGHKIERYWPTGEKPQVDAQPSNYMPSYDSVRLTCVDTVFQALAMQQKGIAALSLNGILSRGFSHQGYFPFDQTAEVRDQTWKSADAAALSRLLNLPNLLPDHPDNVVLIMCEPEWRVHDSFEKSMFFLQQMMALSQVISAHRFQLSVVTPFSTRETVDATTLDVSTETGLDLDHVLAADWYGENFHSGQHHTVEFWLE